MRRGIVCYGSIVWLLAGSGVAQAGMALQRAIDLFSTARYTESQTLLRRRVTTHPEDATAHYYLGKTYLQLGDYNNAIRHCQRAVRIAADQARHHFCLGHSYGEKARRAPKWKQAVLAPKIRRALERTVTLDPSHVKARIGLTHFYLRAPRLMGGSLEKAYDQAKMLIQPDAAQGQALLEKIEAQRGAASAAH